MPISNYNIMKKFPKKQLRTIDEKEKQINKTAQLILRVFNRIINNIMRQIVQQILYGIEKKKKVLGLCNIYKLALFSE